MFRSHDKRAHGLFLKFFSFRCDCYTRFPFVLAVQGTKKLVSIDRFIFSFPFVRHSVVILLYSADMYI